jgi:hypothetical protein
VHKSKPWSARGLTRAFAVERVKGIEPSLSAWESHKVAFHRATVADSDGLAWHCVDRHRLGYWPVDGPAPAVRVAKILIGSTVGLGVAGDTAGL